MSVVVYVLTALAAVVVVLTRVRLRGESQPGGRTRIARRPLDVHTGAGVLALVTWTTFLVGRDSLGEDARSLIGIAALLCWWVVVGAGLLILMRWLPARGRHASPVVTGTWFAPALSLVGHVGMLLGVLYFTYAYLISGV